MASCRNKEEAEALIDHWPLPNVWVGVSAKTQRWADVCIPRRLSSPAAICFLSAESLFGPIDLAPSLRRKASPRLDRVTVDGESGLGHQRFSPREAGRHRVGQGNEGGLLQGEFLAASNLESSEKCTGSSNLVPNLDQGEPELATSERFWTSLHGRPEGLADHPASEAVPRGWALVRGVISTGSRIPLGLRLGYGIGGSP